MRSSQLFVARNFLFLFVIFAGYLRFYALFQSGPIKLPLPCNSGDCIPQ